MGVLQMMKRIQELEKMYEESLDCVEKMECMLDAFDSLQDTIEVLSDYYANGWITDFEADEKHPLCCQKGILSEDGLYDLLERYDEIKKRIG